MKKTLFTLLFVAALPLASLASQTTNANDLNSPELSIVIEADDEWDDILDDYEELVDKVIPLYEASKKGDAATVKEYNAVLSKMLALQTKLAKVKSDLSFFQAARYAKISLKYAMAIK